MSRVFHIFIAAVFALGVGLPQAWARELTPAEKRLDPYSGYIPFCSDVSVLSKIGARFNESEEKYWHSGLYAAGYDEIEQTGYRVNGVDYIPRRYCRAIFWTNDLKTRNIVYSIAEDLGLSQNSILMEWEVEWCVEGLDRNYAFGDKCTAAGP